MKKQITIGIGIIACVALCAAVWPRRAEVEDLPAEPVKSDVTAEREAQSEETPQILLSADTSIPESEPVTKSEPVETGITAEEKTEKPEPMQTAQQVRSGISSTEPHMGDVRVVNGEKQIYIDGFGWIKDEDGGSGGTMVGNPGDELASNKVGIMGGGTTVDGKGDINKQVARP